METSGIRRLAAILFTAGIRFPAESSGDSASRRVEHDAVLRAAIERQGGRIALASREGWIVEFQSAIHAVRCALEIQDELTRLGQARGALLGEPPRIGIEAGEIQVVGQGILGEPLDRAPELAGRVAPGEIGVSGAVLDLVRGKVQATARPDGDAFVLVRSARWRERWFQVGRRGWALAAIGLLGGVGLGLWMLRPRPVPHGGTLRVASSLERGKLEPYGDFSRLSSDALNEVLEPLVTDQGDGTFSPQALERWTVDPAGLRVELQLRPGLRFHPHPCLPQGKSRVADAQDLVFSIEAAARRKGTALPLEGLQAFMASEAQHVSGVRASGPGAVTLTLTRPYVFAEEDLAEISLLPRELAACDSLWDLSQPVGTGPLRFTAPARFENLSLESWEESRAPALLDRVELIHANDPEDAIAQLRDGRYDVVILSAAEAKRVLVPGAPPRLDPRFGVTGAEVGQTVINGAWLGAIFLVKRPESPLGDVRVRRALAEALDRQTLSAAYGLPDVTASGRVLSPWMVGGSAKHPLELGRDLPLALALLAEAGHPDGAGLAEIVIAHAPERRAVAEALRGQAALVGLKVRPVEMSLMNLGDAITHATVDGYVGFNQYATRGAEPWPYLGAISWSALQRGYGDAMLRAPFDRAQVEPNRTGREEQYRAIEQRLLESVAIIPIAESRATMDSFRAYFVVRPGVRGLIDPATGRVAARRALFSGVWIDR